MKKAVNLRKRALTAGMAAAFAVGSLPASVLAAPLVVAGDYIKLADSYGTTGGGEFVADVLTKGTASDFITFCLEYNEYFTPGQTLKVGAVSVAADYGGISGGHPDPIDPRTAYLYTQFSLGTGGALASTYDFTHTGTERVKDANSLQRAIWFIEGELGASYTLSQLDALDHQAKLWVDQASSSGWTTIGNVRALNLLRQDGSGHYTVKAQDQLYITPVPEPETYAMLLAGLGLMGFVARRRKAQAA